MDVQGERGHYIFTDNTSLLTDLCSPPASDKLFLSWIMMTILFLLCAVIEVLGTENWHICPFYAIDTQILCVWDYKTLLYLILSLDMIKNLQKYFWIFFTGCNILMLDLCLSTICVYMCLWDCLCVKVRNKTSICFCVRTVWKLLWSYTEADKARKFSYWSLFKCLVR